MAGEVGNNIQSIPESDNSAGNYHKGNGNTDDCTMSVYSNAKSQPSVSRIQDLLLQCDNCSVRK